MLRKGNNRAKLSRALTKIGQRENIQATSPSQNDFVRMENRFASFCFLLFICSVPFDGGKGVPFKDIWILSTSSWALCYFTSAPSPLYERKQKKKNTKPRKNKNHNNKRLPVKFHNSLFTLFTVWEFHHFFAAKHKPNALTGFTRLALGYTVRVGKEDLRKLDKVYCMDFPVSLQTGRGDGGKERQCFMYDLDDCNDQNLPRHKGRRAILPGSD